MNACQFYLSLHRHQMKRIVVLIIVLLAAIISMAYLYFSGLEADYKNNDQALYSATARSAFIFSFQNDKRIFDILKDQPLLSEVIGEKMAIQADALYQYFLSIPGVSQSVSGQNTYICLLPGSDKKIKILYTTQINNRYSEDQFESALKSSRLNAERWGRYLKFKLPDSSIYYCSVHNKLLLLSIDSNLIENASAAGSEKSNKFADYIAGNSKLQKNTLAEVYINFSDLPELLKMVIPGKLIGGLSVLDQQHGYATLVYNYSAEKILLTGTTRINDEDNYLLLFNSLRPVKTTITNLLPHNTANFTAYAIENYATWRGPFGNWLKENREGRQVASRLTLITNKYRIDPELIFPKYFKDQLIYFQLSTGEKLGAINLSNGEKLQQLLLDLSNSYSDDIRIFKEPDLLFAYFGDAFKDFQKPYYVIKDNCLVFANNASTIQSFLNSYLNNKLLINERDYMSSVNQLPNSASITYYIGFKNSSGIFLKNIYLPYYRHLTDRAGMKNYSSFFYQLSSERGKFQTNILLNKKDSLLTLP